MLGGGGLFFFFQAEDGIRDGRVLEFRRVLFRSSLGGSANGFTALGEVIGPSVPKSEVASTIERIVEAYRALRADGERFIDTLRRVGLEPFREGAYATHP